MQVKCSLLNIYQLCFTWLPCYGRRVRRNVVRFMKKYLKYIIILFIIVIAFFLYNSFYLGYFYRHHSETPYYTKVGCDNSLGEGYAFQKYIWQKECIESNHTFFIKYTIQFLNDTTFLFTQYYDDEELNIFLPLKYFFGLLTYEHKDVSTFYLIDSTAFRYQDRWERYFQFTKPDSFLINVYGPKPTKTRYEYFEGYLKSINRDTIYFSIDEHMVVDSAIFKKLIKIYP